MARRLYNVFDPPKAGMPTLGIPGTGKAPSYVPAPSQLKPKTTTTPPKKTVRKPAAAPTPVKPPRTLATIEKDPEALTTTKGLDPVYHNENLLKGLPDDFAANAFKPNNVQAPVGLSWQDQVARGAEDLAPFISNIANTFRRPPQPAVPKSLDPVRLQRVNFSGDLAEVDRTIAGQNQGLDYLPENQATAVRTANMVQGIRGRNQITQAEANQNAQIGNQESMANLGVNQANVAGYNQWQDDRTNMAMAQQAQQSANLANAADKYVGIRTENRKQDLDLDRYAIMEGLYRDSGVLKRFMDNQNLDPETGLPTYRKHRFGGTLKYRAGGMMKVYGNGGYLDPPGTRRPPTDSLGRVVPVPAPVTPNWGSRTNMSTYTQNRTLEADRAVDAAILSPHGQLQNNNFMLNAPAPVAQTAEAMRSGDYYAPPVAPRHQYVVRKPGAPIYAQNPVANAVLPRYKSGGMMRKVY